MDEQDKAIIETSKKFLDRFNCAYEYMEEPLETLKEFFDLYTDWDWIIYVHIKTSEWEFSHWYILDIEISDTESIIKWIKKYTENVLRFQYWKNV